MSDSDQIAGLESALVDRANKLADEYLSHGRQEHERILTEARQRLRMEEEREVQAARAQADRSYQQQVQAAELQFRSELDRLRMSLVSTVLSHLSARLEQLAADQQRYLPLLRAWLQAGAQAIERDDLVVQVNRRDWQLLQDNWEQYAQQAAPGKRMELSAQPLDCLGGVLVSSTDGNIRFDNTFEGRMERLGEELQSAVAGQLVAAATEVQVG